MRRRQFLIGLGLCATAGIAQARQPRPNTPAMKTKAFSALIPAKVGEFTFNTESGLVLPPPDALADRIYDNTVTRTYTGLNGQVIMLLIAYNNRQDGVLQLHRPETCYPAAGYALTPIRPVDVAVTPSQILPAQVFAALREERDEVVLYWTRVGQKFPRRWLDQRVAVAEANLRGVIPDGVLVRVSTVGSDIQGAMPVLSNFVAGLRGASNIRARTLLFGAG